MTANQMLSRKIKQYRKALDLTQEEFASEIGVESQHISAVERGSKGISIDKLLEICRKFNLNMDDLLPISDFDDAMKEKWIDEIFVNLQNMDVVQLGVLRRMIASFK